jgi:hypothetical protein
MRLPPQIFNHACNTYLYGSRNNMERRVSMETNFLTLHPSCVHDSGQCEPTHTVRHHTRLLSIKVPRSNNIYLNTTSSLLITALHNMILGLLEGVTLRRTECKMSLWHSCLETRNLKLRFRAHFIDRCFLCMCWYV